MDQETLQNQNELVDTTAPVNDFLKEIEQPTTPALGTSIPNGPEPVYESAIPNSAPPPPPPAQDEPIFKQEDTAAQPEPEAPKKERSADYKRKMVRTLIIGENFATTRICGIIAGTEEWKQFGYTDDDLELLLDLLEPYYDMIIEKVPAWLPILAVYGGFKTQQVMRTVKVYKTNKANAAARTDETVKEKVYQAAAAEGQRERTRFTINAKGEYTYDRFGNYVKKDEVKEMADIKDLDRILESNKPSVVMEAFKLSAADMKARGVDIDA